MIQPTTDWKKVAKDFASDYLLPAGGLIGLLVIALGILALAGLGLTLAIFVSTVVILLLIFSLLTSEMTWRIGMLDAVLGIGATFYATNALVSEPVWTIMGIAFGALFAWMLYLLGDPKNITTQIQKSAKPLTDLLGKTHKTFTIVGQEPDVTVLSGSIVGFLVWLLCWIFGRYGTWSLFLGLYASLALGRAIGWFSVEIDSNTKIFWRPYTFLRRFPPFQQIFIWWHQMRRIIGIGFAHWVQE